MKARNLDDIAQGARVSVSGIVVQRAGEGADPARQLVGIQLPGGQLIQVNPRLVDLPDPDPETETEPETAGAADAADAGEGAGDAVATVQTREVPAPRRRRS